MTSQLAMLVPALGAPTDGRAHNLWWLILALVVFALVMPLAYLAGTRGGKPPLNGGPPRRV
jgi:hypothetical protein